MTVTLLDPIGASLSLLATYYFTKAHLRAWPISIAAILVNAILYGQKGIYGQMGLEVIYFITTLYGWFYWLEKKKSAQTIGHIPTSMLFMSLPCIGLCIFLISFLLEHFFESSIAYWDASITVLSIAAQLMLCRKWIECWILWFIVDAAIVALHWQRGIPFHSVIHFIYLGFAIKGYYAWRKIKTQERLEHGSESLAQAG